MGVLGLILGFFGGTLGIFYGDVVLRFKWGFSQIMFSFKGNFRGGDEEFEGSEWGFSRGI